MKLWQPTATRAGPGGAASRRSPLAQCNEELLKELGPCKTASTSSRSKQKAIEAKGDGRASGA